MGIEELLTTLGIELPPAPKPVGSYMPVRVSGELAFVSGQVAIEEGQVLYPGHVGGNVTLEGGAAAARRCGLQALAALKDALGSLDRVHGIVQLQVFVASAPGFNDQPKVANGASDLFVEIFGDQGRHARAAVGVLELPLGASVEVAVVAQIG
ncbi:MAG: RidA family protein [Actinomycetota bacterium]